MNKETFLTLGKILCAAAGEDVALDAQYADDARNLGELASVCRNHNGWFTPEYVKMQLRSLSQMLNRRDLEAFYKKYALDGAKTRDVKVKLIPAGNIPLVCFHDLVCILLSGCTCIIKYSSKDTLLPKAVVAILKKIDPSLQDRIIEEQDGQRLVFDAIIATGSNNTSRYFDYYFSKYPHIIRRNRHSVSVLTGNETPDDYHALADDIFAYYGLGCRSVSKIYVPKDYDYNTFFGNIIDHCTVAHNAKYSDNYTYNKAIYLMSDAKFLDNNFLLLKEDEGIGSPIGVLYAERYDDIEALSERLRGMKDDLQCVVSANPLPGLPTVGFGKAQYPSLMDYADGVDTMEFLINA
ncbi:MAG: aldehyde dehydrogenase [Bacteroidales bacterium]|nr:aldehyde dehydrogenase [Bacteroidales bacterium]